MCKDRLVWGWLNLETKMSHLHVCRLMTAHLSYWKKINKVWDGRIACWKCTTKYQNKNFRRSVDRSVKNINTLVINENTHVDVHVTKCWDANYNGHCVILFWKGTLIWVIYEWFDLQTLEDKDRKQLSQKEQLRREHRFLMRRLESLQEGQYRVRQERSISECSTATNSTSSNSESG